MDVLGKLGLVRSCVKQFREYSANAIEVCQCEILNALDPLTSSVASNLSSLALNFFLFLLPRRRDVFFFVFGGDWYSSIFVVTNLKWY